jgi:hypothetical protein
MGPSGPVLACNGIALPLPLFYLTTVLYYFSLLLLPAFGLLTEYTLSEPTGIGK